MDEQTELDLLRQAEDEWIDYLHAFDQVNPAQALNMADMSFLYPNMSSDTTVALALQNVLATSQTASQLARLENREQNRSLLQNIGHGLKAGVRTLALGVDGIWEEGFSRPFRTSVLCSSLLHARRFSLKTSTNFPMPTQKQAGPTL